MERAPRRRRDATGEEPGETTMTPPAGSDPAMESAEPPMDEPPTVEAPMDEAPARPGISDEWQ
jgi:hypothetical protein